MKDNETRIGWMENGELEVAQYHCPKCDTIFHFAADYEEDRIPGFCPICGRKNLRAA